MYVLVLVIHDDDNKIERTCVLDVDRGKYNMRLAKEEQGGETVLSSCILPLS